MNSLLSPSIAELVTRCRDLSERSQRGIADSRRNITEAQAIRAQSRDAISRGKKSRKHFPGLDEKRLGPVSEKDRPPGRNSRSSASGPGRLAGSAVDCSPSR